VRSGFSRRNNGPAFHRFGSTESYSRLHTMKASKALLGSDSCLAFGVVLYSMRYQRLCN
jgi:hypothetical protein